MTTKKNERPSKRVLGVALILVSILIVLGYSTISNPQSANAIVSFDPHTNLKHFPSGKADLAWNAQKQSLTVSITLFGLAPNSTHPAHIHQGSCETSDNGVYHALNPVIADKSGKGYSNTKIDLVKNGIPASGWFINVHNGPTLSPDIQKTPIACGDITNFNTSTNTDQFITLHLGPTKNVNQAVNGLATLSLANHQLKVTITLSGLEPGSTHQAHIHQGSCKAQGIVVHPLTPIVADKDGNSTTTTIIPKVSSIPNNWYVNVHQAATQADLGTQTGFDPLVCGDIAAQ